MTKQPDNLQEKMQQDLLTIEDVTKRVKLSRRTIFTLLQKGEFPEPLRPSPKKMFWTPAAIDHYFKDLEVKSIQATKAKKIK